MFTHTGTMAFLLGTWFADTLNFLATGLYTGVYVCDDTQYIVDLMS